MVIQVIFMPKMVAPIAIRKVVIANQPLKDTKLTSPDNLLKSNCRASLLALGVLILSIHLYSGSSETTNSSTKPGKNWAL